MPGVADCHREDLSRCGCFCTNPSHHLWQFDTFGGCQRGWSRQARMLRWRIPRPDGELRKLIIIKIMTPLCSGVIYDDCVTLVFLSPFLFSPVLLTGFMATRELRSTAHGRIPVPRQHSDHSDREQRRPWYLLLRRWERRRQGQASQYCRWSRVFSCHHRAQVSVITQWHSEESCPDFMTVVFFPFFKASLGTSPAVRYGPRVPRCGLPTTSHYLVERRCSTVKQSALQVHNKIGFN